MNNRQKLMLITLFTGLSAWSGVAQARHQTPQERLNDMKINAARLFHALNYTGALNLFLKAYEVDDEDPVLVWNIARCYEELGQTAQAIRFFKDYIVMVSDPRKKKAAQKKVNRLMNADKGILVFQVNPKDSQVFINGENYDISQGQLLVVPGTYHIQVVHPGYNPSLQDIKVMKGQTIMVRVDLAEIPGHIKIIAMPKASYSEVFLDGRLSYKGPLPHSIPCASGQHRVVVRRAAGFQDFSGSVDVKSGSVAEVRLSRALTQEADLLDSDNDTITPRKSITKPALTWTGFALLVLGGAMNTWGYIEYSQGKDNYKWKYYTAYGLYGVGAGLLITGIVLPKPKNEKFTWTFSPGPEGVSVGFLQAF